MEPAAPPPQPVLPVFSTKAKVNSTHGSTVTACIRSCKPLQRPPASTSPHSSPRMSSRVLRRYVVRPLAPTRLCYAHPHGLLSRVYPSTTPKRRTPSS
jgi:hypothetical protein